MADIKVIGHVPADTDSVLSPIVYAWYLKNIKGMDAEAVVGSSLNKETKFVLAHFNIPAPTQISELTETDKFVLLDSNNPQELISGYDKAELIEIIDHHKLVGGLSTASPISITIKPLACTATLLSQIMMESADQIPVEMKNLLLAAMVSDTLNFTSPTTTDFDRHVAEELKAQTGTNVDELAQGMFEAKSDISDMSARDVVLSDYKDFNFGGNNYRICSIETAVPAKPLERLADLKNEAEAIKTENNLAGVFVFIIDIINAQNSVMFATSESEQFAEKAFNSHFNGDTMAVPGVVSRKKQIVPAFEAAVA